MRGLYRQDDSNFTEILEPELQNSSRGEAPCRRIPPNQSGFNRLGLRDAPLRCIRVRLRGFGHIVTLHNRFAVLLWPLCRPMVMAPNQASIQVATSQESVFWLSSGQDHQGEGTWNEFPTILLLVAQTMQHGMGLLCAVVLMW